jgi:hypothetical protein
MADTNEQNKAYITGLLAEKAGWEQKDDTDPAYKDAATTIKKIDAELRRVGHEAKAPAKRAERRPRAKAEKRA